MIGSRVILISNDVLPGSEMPVAAPGLRVFSLAEGLKAHGFDVTAVVVRGLLDSIWAEDIPLPVQRGVEVISQRRLQSYLRSHRPATVILTNSNQIDHLERMKGIRFVLDFFAPKMLETAYSREVDYPVEELRELRQRKLKAIDLADAFIVNGRKKIPYFLAWLMQSDRDLRGVPFKVVEMGMPSCFRDRDASDAVDLVIAGYLQGWSKPGPWLDSVMEAIEPGRVHLHLLMPPHWGQREDLSSGEIAELRQQPGVFDYDAMLFSDFQEWMAGMDVALDLFSHSREREYAMVTRSIVALACGVPVMHPPFTEVSPMIREFDAGWVVPPQPEAVASALEEVVGDPEARERKAEGARALWRERLDPAVAVRPLLDVLSTMEGGGGR